METKEQILSFDERPPFWKAWFLATRPKTLTVSLIPVLVGTLLAHTHGTAINWGILLIGWLCVLLLQIGTNLVNDAIDFKKGADDERIGPKRACREGWLNADHVLRAGVLCFVLSLVFGIPLIIKGGWAIAFIMVISCFCGYFYTGGPFPLSYQGIADLFTFVFFGIVGTVAFYFLQTGSLHQMAILAGVQIGLYTVVISATNNLRDVHQDAKVNKKTIPVRFGIKVGKIEIIVTSLIPYLLGVFWWAGDYQLAALLPLMTLPLALQISRSIWTHEPSAVYNAFFKKTTLLHLLFGLCLAGGIAMKSFA